MQGRIDNEATEKIRQVGWVGLVSNLLLATAKAVAGIFGNSHALVADAVHSLSDSVTDIAVILGVRFWTAPADEEHPHGHGRIETLITVLIGLAIGLVAIGIGWEAIQGLRTQTSPEAPSFIALCAALLSIVVKEILFRWTITAGRKVDSPALVANAWHHRSDAFSSVPVALAVGAGIVTPKLAFIDRVGAVVVSVFIFQAAWSILRPALNQLIDAGVPAAERRRIEELACQVDGVEAAHAVRTRHLGAQLAVDLHVEVDGGLSVAEGHVIALGVKQRLIDNGPQVADVVVQIEPFQLQITD